jgi:chromatin assembly factor 1 subunit B
VRFAPSGTLLASVGDGGTLIIWRQSEHPIAHSKMFGEEEDEGSEYWATVAMIRVSDGEDIYDLAWSPDDRYVLIGLTDNTAQIWELSTRTIS